MSLLDILLGLGTEGDFEEVSATSSPPSPPSPSRQPGGLGRVRPDPAELLARLAQLGARVSVVGANLRIVCRQDQDLPADLLAELRAAKPQLIELLVTTPRPTMATTIPMASITTNATAAIEDGKATEYEALIHQAFQLIADGEAADPETCRFLRDESGRLHDEIGGFRAPGLRREIALKWFAERQRCPWCGEAGVFHDPDHGGEPRREGT